MAQKKVSVKFRASAWQIKTMQKGGISISLSIDESEVENISLLLSQKQTGVGLDIIARPVKLPKVEDAQKGKTNNGRTRKRRRYPYKD